MAITTNVPSNNFEDLQRDVQDATRFTNATAPFTNRVGQSITPIPVRDSQLAAKVAEAASAVEALGWFPAAGSFTDGGTITARNQVLFNDADGSFYSWSGELPKVVPAASTPASAGGISANAWINRGDATLRSGLAAPDSNVLVGGRFAREIGYAGDIRRFLNRATNDHQRALVDALEFCRAEQQSLYIPGGDWYFEESTPAGGMVAIIGDGVSVTRLNLNLPAGSTYLFNINSNGGGRRHVSGLSITGSGQYSAKDGFISMTNAYNTEFSYISAFNSGRVFNLLNSWGCHLKNMRIMFVDNPINMLIPNGSTIENVYIQRFVGSAVRLEAGLATGIKNLILEYGQNADGSAGGTGLVMLGMESYTVDGLYTEGSMGTEVQLTFKNQKACMNGKIRNYWCNGSVTNSVIRAESVRGLTIEDVTMITPSKPLIDFSNRIYSDGLIDVGKVSQIDPNTNGFLGQLRGAGQDLVPIATNNSLIRMVDYQPKIGNGTNADLNNIAPHTQVDSDGRLPFSAFAPSVSAASQPSGLTATSSATQNVFGAGSSGITLLARSHCRVPILITGTMTSSSGTDTFAAFRLTNETTGATEATTVRNTGASGTESTQGLFINLAPGRNVIKLAITRVQGGSGTNTFTVSDFVVDQP